MKEKLSNGTAFGAHPPSPPLPRPLPKFRDILRVSPARRGFNGVRCSGNKLEFLRLRISGTPAAATLYTRSLRFRGFSNRIIYLFLFHFLSQVFESRFTSRRQPRETNRDVEFSRKDERRAMGRERLSVYSRSIES